MSGSTLSHSILTLCILVAATSASWAGFEDLGVGARPLGMAGAYVALVDDADAIFINPAGMGQAKGFNASVFYARPFGLQELAYSSVAVLTPFPWGWCGGAAQIYGGDLYRETTFVVSYANRYGRTIFYGFNLRHMSVHIKNYGFAQTFGLDGGLLLRLTPNLHWGFFTRNLNRPTIGQDREKLPQIFSTGLSVRPVQGVILNFDAYKDVRFPLELRCGVEYWPFPALALRTGVANNPPRFAAGVGISVFPFRIDYALYTHQDLGLTHQVSLVIGLGEPKPSPSR